MKGMPCCWWSHDVAPATLTYASSVSHETVCTALMIVVLNAGLELKTCDVINAPINAPINKKIMMVL